MDMPSVLFITPFPPLNIQSINVHLNLHSELTFGAKFVDFVQHGEVYVIWYSGT
jgi:hypothetical protein